MQNELFLDPSDSGWYSTTGKDPAVLLRLKEDYDGAEPSGASVTVRNLIRLAQLTGESGYLEQVQRALERYGPGLGQVVRVMPLMASNLALWHARRTEIVLAGAAGAPEVAGLERVVSDCYLPWSVVVPLDPKAHRPSPRMPWLAAMKLKDDQPTAYVCQDFACQSPTNDPEQLRIQVEDAAATRRIIAP